MPISLTRPVGTVISDAVPTNKGHHRDLFNDLITGANGMETALGGLITAETVARAADKLELQTAIRRTGPIDLVISVGSTGDAILATLDSISSSGATAISTTMLVNYTPTASNVAQTPTLTVGGSTYNIRDADGNAWPAGGFVPGRSYILRRDGSQIRVVQENSRAAVATERANRINNILEAGNIELTDVGGTPTAITANIPAGLAGSGITATNLKQITLTLPWDIGANATLSINGGDALLIRTSTDGPISAGAVPLNRPTTLIKQGSRWRLRQDASALDINSLKTRTTTVETTLTTGVYQALIQTGATVPTRPLPKDQGLYTWYVFDKLDDYPAGPMGPFDTQRILEAVEPDVPGDDTWDFRGDGNGDGVIRVFEVPVQRPEISEVEYSVDEGAFVGIPKVGGVPVPGDYMVPMATGERSVALRHANFRGTGVATLSRTRTIAAGNVTFALPPSGAILHNTLPVDWRLIYQDGNPGNRGLQTNTDMLRPTHDNAATRCMSQEWYPTDQWIEGEIEQLYASMSIAAREGIGFGVNCSRDGNAGLMVIFQQGGLWLLRSTGPDAYATTLATVAMSITPTPSDRTQIRIAREGALLRVRVNGTWVLEHTLTGDALATVGGAPQIYAHAPNIALARTELRFRPLTAGRG